MANVLQFTLGLEVSKFLTSCGISSAAVVGISTAFTGLQKVADQVFNQIARGAALNDLSKRTGESVANLFSLQKAFVAVGLSSDSVGSALFQMNKALGGINDAGEDTASIFAKVGLNVETLKKAGGGTAMQQILGRIAGMDQSTATAFASRVFGRGEAGNMVQAARQLSDFNEAIAASRAQAAVFQRVAGLFDAIDKAIIKVRAKLDPLFLVLAEKLAPIIKTILDWVNAINLSPIADAIADAFDAVYQVFAEGRLLQLLTATFDAATEYFGNILFGVIGNPAFWSGVFDVMLSAFNAKYIGIAKAMLNLSAALMRSLGLPTDGVEKTNKQLNKWLGASLGPGAAGLGTIADVFSSAQANAGGPMQDALSELIQGLIGRRRPALAPGGPAQAAQLQSFNLGKEPGSGTVKSDATALEKMGFVFTGTAAANASATTAKNTTRMVSQLDRIASLLTGTSTTMEPTNASA